MGLWNTPTGSNGNASAYIETGAIALSWASYHCGHLLFYDADRAIFEEELDARFHRQPQSLPLKLQLWGFRSYRQMPMKNAAIGATANNS